MNRSRRRHKKPPRPTKREQALLAWLNHHMQDPFAAPDACRVTLIHTGLIAWMAAAELSRALPAAGAALGGSVTQTREPDDAIVNLVADVLETGGWDPEHLDPIRARLSHHLSRDAAWYVDHTGSVELEEWEPLATRLGDLIGDQHAAGALATSIIGHRRLVLTGMTRQQKAARERWRRQKIRYVRVLDEQPTKGRVDQGGRTPTEWVDQHGQRWIAYGEGPARPVDAKGEAEGERRFG